MELYQHQKDVLKNNKPKLGLFHAPGLGKTITLLELAKENDVQALIICPKGIKKQWIEYVDKYKASHVVYTKEEFRKLHKDLPRFSAVIVDEAHHFSNLKSALTKSLLWYLKYHTVHYRWLATGTPYRSSAMNIYALGKLLGYDWNYWKFFSTFFMMVNMGQRQVPVPIKDREEELEEYVKQIGVTLALDEVMDVPEQSFHTEILPLTEEQEKAIKELDEPTPIARFTKVHCIEQGFEHGNEYEQAKVYQNNKTSMVINLCIQWKRIAVVCRYTMQIKMLQQILVFKFPNRKIFVISGTTKDRHTTVNEINESDDCIVLIQSQCSEGYELPKVEAMVFASLSWSHVDHIQMKARISRMNALKENSYYYLVSKGIDERVYTTIMNHQDFHEKLYENQ